MELRRLNKRRTALGLIAIASIVGLVGCVKAESVRADRDWYTLKEATNGRNMVRGSWQMCLYDPSCSPQERTELRRERDRAEAEYRKAWAAVQYDHAHGWYADVSSMPPFARDPSLGLSP